jgi:hypothetical protein
VYPVDSAEPGTILFGDGKVWTLRGDDLRPFDLRDDALAGTIGQLPLGGGPLFVDGSVWALRLDPENECMPGYFNYILVQIDPTTNAIARAISVPIGCRYGNDTRSPRPTLVGGGGAVWISNQFQAAEGLHVVRVDTATGEVSTMVLPESRAVVASDEEGAWVAGTGTVEAAPRFDNGVQYLVVGPTTLDRIDHTGAVVASDLLPTARFLSRTFAADAGGLWVSSAKAPSSATEKWTLELARVTRSGKRIVVAGVTPWSIATGDGQVWFLGSRDPRRSATAPTPAMQLLGRIDPRTGDVVQRIRLHLPASPPSMEPPVVKPRIVGVMDGRVWIDPVHFGPGRQPQLVRVEI